MTTIYVRPLFVLYSENRIIILCALVVNYKGYQLTH